MLLFLIDSYARAHARAISAISFYVFSAGAAEEERSGALSWKRRYSVTSLPATSTETPDDEDIKKTERDRQVPHILRRRAADARE